MAKKKDVLLVKDVLKVGNMGDVVRVAPGFARNYLFPYGLAVSAEGAAKRQIEVLREKAAKAEIDREAKANELKKKLLGLTITIKARVAHDDVLFGSIGAKELVTELTKVGFTVDTKQIHLHDKLRKVGSYKVEVRLHKNVPVEITLLIQNADPNATMNETLAAAAKTEAADAKATDGKAASAKGDAKADAKPAKGKADGKGDSKADSKGDKKADSKADHKADKTAKKKG